MEIFDGDEKKLKQCLFHDWKCYLYQFSVIANGSEWYMAINPDTVLSTVINLGMYNVHESGSRSTKVNCAEILKERRPVSNLVEKWLGNSLIQKDCFSFVHDCINFTLIAFFGHDFSHNLQFAHFVSSHLKCSPFCIDVSRI